MAAAGAGDIEVVNSLLSQVPDLAIDGICKESGRTALNAAVVELIKQELNVEDHFQNDFNWAKQPQFWVIKVLIENNTYINMMFPASGKNAIITAIESGQTEVVKMLINWGADVNCSCQGYMPLLIACIFDKPKIAKHLLGKRVDVHHCTPDCITPISASLSASEKCVILCVKSGVDVNTLVMGVHC